jgi:2-haloacid dehalogenase
MPHSRPGLVTLDAYTALVDYERGLVPVIERVCAGVDAAAFARAWRAKQMEYAQHSNSLARERIPFRVVTRRALDYTLARAGVEVAPSQRGELETAWDALPPWPEATATVSELAARGYRLAILSNGDVDMLRALMRGWDVPLEFLGCDQAGHYKPHPSVYALPERILGVQASRVLHVAGSATDVLGCKLAGMRCAWSNRIGDRVIDPEVRADHEMRDLSGLLAILPA